MVLPHENIFSLIQPNLGFQDDQEDIISSLNTFVWRYRRNASRVLEEEERREKALERVVQRRNI